VTFSLLAEVKAIEAHVQEAMARMAQSLNGKPFPPQAIKLGLAQRLLREIRTSLEQPPTPSAVPPVKPPPAEVEWGMAFRGPLPTPAAPPPRSDAGSIARAWSEEEAEPPSAAPTPLAPRPASSPKRKDTHKDQGDESWQWDQE
jgi:hypothetical protein